MHMLKKSLSQWLRMCELQQCNTWARTEAGCKCFLERKGTLHWREDCFIRKPAWPACHLQGLVRFLWSSKNSITNDVLQMSQRWASLIKTGEQVCNWKCSIFINHQEKTTGHQSATWESKLLWKILQQKFLSTSDFEIPYFYEEEHPNN